jgi:hypothetical protein
MLVCIVILASCSNAELKSGGGAKQKPASSPTGADKPGDGSPTDPLVLDSKEGEENLLTPPEFLLTPALAARQANCVMCHANVTGDVITDFNMHAKPFSSRTASGTIEQMTSKLIIDSGEGFRPLNWGTANINGKIIVPNAPIQGTLLSLFEGDMTGFSVVDAVTRTIKGINAGELASSGNIKKMLPVVGAARNKAVAGVNDVVSFNNVAIDPPTESEIKALLTHAYAKDIGGSDQVKFVSIGALSTATGLAIKSGSGGQYVTNSGDSVSCTGDIVVGGTLVLKDVETFNVGAGGCRLYVQKTAFIRGSLKAVGAPNDGIQIGAGRAILMGILYNRTVSPDVSVERDIVKADLEDAGPSVIMTRKSGTNITIIAKSDYREWSLSGGVSEFVNLSSPHWQWLGSARPPVGSVCRYDDTEIPIAGTNNGDNCWIRHPSAVVSDLSTYRKSAQYEGVLFAAPNVQSRYLGSIKGTIIADFALVALDRLQFSADPRFEKTPGLQRLKRPLIKISN